jgi:hypothetical protein
MRPNSFAAIAASAIAVISASASAGVYYDGGEAYLHGLDSPFAWTDPSSQFYMEAFEDNHINSPGLSIVSTGGGIVGDWLFADSVDGDDGSVDGNGNGGNSYWVYNQAEVNPSVDIIFDAAEWGGDLPNHAGLVWTDGTQGSTYRFEAFDGSGAIITSFDIEGLGDSTHDGNTAEDRFIGISDIGGIASISLTRVDGAGGFEFDHVQYGFAPIPTPGALALLACAGLFGTRRRRG